jgi:hypothetical protein
MLPVPDPTNFLSPDPTEDGSGMKIRSYFFFLDRTNV